MIQLEPNISPVTPNMNPGEPNMYVCRGTKYRSSSTKYEFRDQICVPGNQKIWNLVHTSQGPMFWVQVLPQNGEFIT